VPNFKEPNMRRNPCLPSKFQKLREREKGKKSFPTYVGVQNLIGFGLITQRGASVCCYKKVSIFSEKKIKEALKIELGIFEKRESAACVLLLI